MPNLTDELSMAKERCLNQFGTAVLVRCGKSFVELNFGSAQGAPSESFDEPRVSPERCGGANYGKRAASESIWYVIFSLRGKSVKFDRVCRTFVELNLGSTQGTPSESDVAPVSLQS